MNIDAICVDWHATPNNTRRRALHRRYIEMFAPKKPTRAKPRPLAGDDVIEQAIRAQLGLRSTPLLGSWELEVYVEHRLAKIAKVSRADIRRVAEKLAGAGALERVPFARRRGFAYRLK
jgi:hypothetical protein